ncbi:OLC1v1009003C1 [Oldenlandia corymbosa var. corymbosa]|uniref:RNA helicase n=1 Tax=Oldenlandia corymbosa var. corymbosa TaxID=529605 RepID=A0AAV1DN73_OLDCO|nr:OLC1v1009003C1 [Oldenlandia corymbosa var. corymbosa]
MREEDSKPRTDDSKLHSSRRSHQKRERGDVNQDKETNGDRTKEMDRYRNRDRDHHHSSDKKDQKHRERSTDDEYGDRDRERYRGRHKESERGKERDSTRDGLRYKIRDREERHADKRKEEKGGERGKHKERHRKRGKERVREEQERDYDRERRERRKKERGIVWVREKSRTGYTDQSGDDSDVKDRDRKRQRRDEVHKDLDCQQTSKSAEYNDNSEDSCQHKPSNEDFVDEKNDNKEEVSEELRKLDEEAEKRRRRVQEWQQLKRQREESERGSLGVAANNEPQSGKTWTLEGESDSEEAKSDGRENTDMDLDEGIKPINSHRDGHLAATLQNEVGGAIDDEEVDPLDAFMNAMVVPEVERLHGEPPSLGDVNNDLDAGYKRRNGKHPKKGVDNSMGRIFSWEDSDSDYENYEDKDNHLEDENDNDFLNRVKEIKAKKLPVVDHSKMDYPPLRKDFYIEAKEISAMTYEEVAAYRKQLELKVHGKDVLKPVRSWLQAGLSANVLKTIRKLNCEKPMPIQAQALPVIMSGRDCIGTAKTGSGKTLAFVLPMLRHIKNQSPLMPGDGPIALIMAPTRELVQQIHSDVKKFSKVLGLRCVPVYGGAGVAQQIGELKRGTEIVVCTPGRMIDMLCTSSGKITNLRRVTYLVMDEADRMFDMGFEPQIAEIVQNTRPDRQTVLFSATFPRQVEILARKVLNKPVEIQVGGRSVVNKDIEQLVEVRPESDRFLRLLELLGDWCEKGKILIFVHSQEKCDTLFRDLVKHGHACLSLHGAKDQTDRESTVADFKSNVCDLLIATSVAARGLDVKELELVINYDVPNHYEDYVHRVGRTGRAGRKGTAITFISEDDSRFAPDLVKALELSGQVVPDDLKALADGFLAKVKQGLEKAHGTGYGGSGYKFDEEEDEVRKAAKKAQAKEYGFEECKSDSDEEEDPSQPFQNDALPVRQENKQPAPVPIEPNGINNLKRIILEKLHKLQGERPHTELEINDFPQNARWKVTHRETLEPIAEFTGASITTRGQFFPPGQNPREGERKLFLYIEGPTEESVKSAKAALKQVLEDVSSRVSVHQPGAKSVIQGRQVRGFLSLSN